MDLEKLFQELGEAFDEFKKTNEESMKQLATKGSVDTLVTEKLAVISEKMSDLEAIKERLEAAETKLNRPGAGSGISERDQLKKDHQDAFRKYFCKADDSGLAELQQKAMNVGTDADGGYAVPEEIDRVVMDLLVEISPMRRICTVKTVSTEDYKKLVNQHGTASGWVGEAAARPETNSSVLAEIAASMGEIYANPATTQKALDDVFFDVEAFMKDEVVTEFAKQEGAAFLNGNATNQPDGLLTVTTSVDVDSARTWGEFQHILSGASGDFTDPDILIDVISSLKEGYRGNARWLTSRLALAKVRKFKDGNNQYLWQPGLQAGQPSSILGYPVTEAEDMPAVAGGSLSYAFGDFQRGYYIVDRMGMRTLRDPYTNKPYVHFYSTKRVGGMPVDSEAVKFIKTTA